MKEITTQTQKITLESSGIVKCKALDGVFIDLEDARENIHAVKVLSGGKTIPVFVDITNAKGATKEARAYFAGDEAGNVQSACALLIASPLASLIGNFFLGLNKTKFPIKLFREEDKAENWLKTFL